MSLSRMATKGFARTLLHLAVYENELDLIALLKKDPVLRIRRDAFGLSPIDLANFLNRIEAIQHLEPLRKLPAIPNLSELEGFKYLTSPIFESRDSLDLVLNTVAKAKIEGKIPSEKIWMGIYFDKEIRDQPYPPVSIQYIDDEIGSGVFADKKIPACTFVGEYTGVIQMRTPKLREKKHCLRYTVWESKKKFAVDAEHKGNFTRFINHSSNPNLGVQSVYWRGFPRIIFISLKEVPEGEQLTFDYGSIFWKSMPKSPKIL